jgi:phage tail sheath gpL-like
MAKHKPADLDALKALPGIEAQKADRYGAEFLRVIAPFNQTQSLKRKSDSLDDSELPNQKRVCLSSTTTTATATTTAATAQKTRHQPFATPSTATKPRKPVAIKHRGNSFISDE